MSGIATTAVALATKSVVETIIDAIRLTFIMWPFQMSALLAVICKTPQPDKRFTGSFDFVASATKIALTADVPVAPATEHNSPHRQYLRGSRRCADGCLDR